MKKLLLAGALLCSAAFAYAKDLGVQGNVWPIVEIDIRRLIMESAARADWNKANQEVLDSGKNYAENLPKRNLPTADSTQITYIDPSIVLTSDIQAPIKQADGTYQWKILYPKGTRVNPMDQFHPMTAFLFIDGSQPDQVELLKQVLAKEPNRIIPVEAGSGNLKDLSDSFARPIFYGNDAMMNRFQVHNLPSLVFPGTGANSHSLGIAAFGRPFNADEVLNDWPDFKLPQLQAPKGNGQ